MTRWRRPAGLLSGVRATRLADPAVPQVDYERDFVEWLDAQAGLITKRRFDEVD